jgi:protein transport protein HofB
MEHVSRFELAVSNNTSNNTLLSHPSDVESFGNYVPDSPVQFLHQLLLAMHQSNASDIHIEPLDNEYRVRVRVDGVLHVFDNLAREFSQRLISRIKVTAKLDIANQQTPQDGQLNFQLNEHVELNLRISTLPLVNGEKVVIRLAQEFNSIADLTQLGLTKSQLELLKKALLQSQGMIVVTGATGSGKSVTLYSCLQYLNSEHRNVCSIEDPVETTLPGISQVQICEAKGLYFTDVLRSMLRQDPDVLMLGEIRDSETADVATKAAQTGHLVLSSLHTSSARGAILRLQNLGVDLGVIRENCSLIIGQKLVRKLCCQCKQSTRLSEQEKFQFPELIGARLYMPVGCDSCYQGYSGRMGIFELCNFESDTSTLQSEQSVRMSLIEAVKKGKTSLTEIRLHLCDS